MAVSRIGGSSGKIRGQVGDTIYQVKRNPDGTYTQYVYSKGGHTEETLTPKLQAQRMCVAMVQSIMRDLKPVAGISFQAGRNKSASLNSFSSNNIRLVQRDCKDHWDGGNLFIYPHRHRTDKEIKDLGGNFMISSGTLERNSFDAVVEEIDAKMYYKDCWSEWPYLYGLTYTCRIGVETVEEFLKRYKLTRSDKVVFAGFKDMIVYEPDPDDPQEFYRNEYMIASINMRIPGNTVMTESVISELFQIQSSMDCRVFFRKDGLGFLIGHLCLYMENDEMFYCVSGFTISYWSGKKEISTSFYTNTEGESTPWLYNAEPAQVFGSWMGEPWHVPYPNPF